MKKEQTTPINTTAVHHRGFEGEVITVAPKTITVLVRRVKMHPKYRKQYTMSKKFSVHDEKQIAKAGDTVSFVECRPLSKTKRWRLEKVVSNS